MSDAAPTTWRSSATARSAPPPPTCWARSGLNVVVIERDPDIYFRARAISTDEEVVRIWQQVGLADRLNADMQPGAGANFVDADGVPFAKLLPADRGNGHPPQQFIYQPAVDRVLRAGRRPLPERLDSCSNTSACASSSTPTLSS